MFRRKSCTYKFVAFIAKRFCKKSQSIGVENIPNEPCIIVSNHSKLYGPVNAELYFPTEKAIWCDAFMMVKKEFPNYAYHNFWGGKPNLFQKAFAHTIAPLVTHVMSRADSLPVYRDMRIINTYKITVQTLSEGVNVVILPESPQEYNEIVNNFNERFVDVARFYYKNYQKQLKFVPMYYSVELRKMVFGKPIEFDSNNNMDDERKRICSYLMQEITKMAKELPRHKVVPFNNVKKSQYKYSK